MSLSTPLIEAKNLSLSYPSQQGNVQALTEIDLSIQRGEFLCLVGPSGCGKSTLLKALAGYLAPTAGGCYMKGKEITGASWERGVVFQSPTLYPWLTIRDNIQYGPKVRKLSTTEQVEIGEYFLEQVELTDFADHYPYELSGGMKQRVALARALANQPEIILMDEPFSALDAITRLKMQDFLRELWQKHQQTILLITHDIEEALSLGTEIAVMSKTNGKIEKRLSVDYSRKILASPTYEATADPDFMAQKLALLQLIS